MRTWTTSGDALIGAKISQIARAYRTARVLKLFYDNLKARSRTHEKNTK